MVGEAEGTSEAKVMSKGTSEGMSKGTLEGVREGKSVGQPPQVLRHVDLAPLIWNLSTVFLVLTHLHDLIFQSTNLNFLVASLHVVEKYLHLEQVIGQ